MLQVIIKAQYLYNIMPPYVLYLDQRMCAVHNKRWSKYTFSNFFEQKSRKKEEKAKKLMKNWGVEVAPDHWSHVLFPEK